jgi:hypothetical protein
MRLLNSLDGRTALEVAWHGRRKKREAEETTI